MCVCVCVCANPNVSRTHTQKKAWMIPRRTAFSAHRGMPQYSAMLRRTATAVVPQYSAVVPQYSASSAAIFRNIPQFSASSAAIFRSSTAIFRGIPQVVPQHSAVFGNMPQYAASSTAVCRRPIVCLSNVFCYHRMCSPTIACVHSL